MGLLLPCNLVVYATDSPNGTVVAAMDPESALALTGNDAIRPIAARVAAKLRRVIEHVSAHRRVHHVAPSGHSEKTSQTTSSVAPCRLDPRPTVS
jgi:hypothetical protein